MPDNLNRPNHRQQRLSGRRVTTGASKTATALHYQPGAADIAPVIIAQESGDLADQLILIAKAKGVPIKEDADLASLISAANVGEEIPLEAFLIVAEIFKFLYAEAGTKAPSSIGESSQYWTGNKEDNPEQI